MEPQAATGFDTDTNTNLKSESKAETGFDTNANTNANTNLKTEPKARPDDERMRAESPIIFARASTDLHFLRHIPKRIATARMCILHKQ
ncbi:MAG TPA: hypothetical protein ENJ18_15840 [Nannocystis exedens]|nr:hypothetical protein [Nannocystis exedens]